MKKSIFSSYFVVLFVFFLSVGTAYAQEAHEKDWGDRSKSINSQEVDSYNGSRGDSWRKELKNSHPNEDVLELGSNDSMTSRVPQSHQVFQDRKTSKKLRF
jgi:hypothetical protein